MLLVIARMFLLGSDPAKGGGEHRRRMLRMSRPFDDRIFVELAQARARLEFTYRNGLDLR